MFQVSLLLWGENDWLFFFLTSEIGSIRLQANCWLSITKR